MPVGVYPRASASSRFWLKVNKDGPIPVPDLGPCWIWLGGKSNGYGIFWLNGHSTLAHRFLIDVPEGLEPDHLCRNRACVRPSHLESVTHSLNVIRGDNGNRKKTRCKHGHLFNSSNTYITPKGQRRCRLCHAQRSKTAYKGKAVLKLREKVGA